MKILMVSIFAPHFFNWTEQLKDSGHEVYWLDVFDSNTHVEKISFADQITGWRYKWNYPGRYFVKKNLPSLNRFINRFNENKFEELFEQKIKEIEPDVVHSFVMYLGTAPILKVMKKYPDLKWIYSSWGSDLFYYRRLKKYREAMQETFPYLDYMFADCQRDHAIAKEYGFEGELLGVFPGGGGFDLDRLESKIKPFESRNTILIKGYQGKHGRCEEVLKAVLELRNELKHFQIVIFGATIEILKFLNISGLDKWSNVKFFGNLTHEKVMTLMGESLIYIGNSSSDGMPNTLLEAIVMGAFPVQSNPGGATAELIENHKNGMLIDDPENIEEIKMILCEVIGVNIDLKAGVTYNFKYIRPLLERNKIKTLVLDKYERIAKELN